MHRRLAPNRTAAIAAATALIAWAPADAAPLLARYEVRAAGVTVMRVEVTFDLDAPGDAYSVSARVRTTGFVGAFSASDHVTLVEGRWQGLRPAPARYRVEGTSRGARRRVVMDYPAPGAAPAIGALEPPEDFEREPVPAELRRGTVDGVSAIAQLARTVARTGRCEGATAVFDGRRRTDWSVRTAGAERLPAGYGGPPGGPALRCVLEGRLLAGFRTDQDPAEARRPLPATAWLAQVEPAAAPIPVRIELPTRWFGTVRVSLVGLGPAPLTSGGRDQIVQQAR